MSQTEQLISVCIPTCERDVLLLSAVASCIEQKYRPIEIVICDDSRFDETERWFKSFVPPEDVEIRYYRNKPRLGQARNVNRLFDLARGERCILLHDDDLLCPDAISILASSWDAHPTVACCYGRQIVINESGYPLVDRTMEWNERYTRIATKVGLQPSPLAAALDQQVPNDGYLVDTSLARIVRCRAESYIGQCVDADFIIRLSRNSGARDFVFVNADISMYRLTNNSIARSKTINHREDLLFRSIEEIEGDDVVYCARDRMLGRISLPAALDAAVAGMRKSALQIIFSPYYSKPLFSRWTIFRLICVISPRLGHALKSKIDAIRCYL